MSKIVVQSYGNGMSKAAKELAQYLEVKRVKVTGSRFRGKIGDVVVNWGIPRNKLANVKYLNNLEAVAKASNKLIAFEAMSRAGVSIPDWSDDLLVIPVGTKMVARKLLHGHSGEGIEIFTMVDGLANNPSAPLYTELIKKKREYRAIVVGETVVDLKQKKKRNSTEGEERIEHDEHVWNLAGGYVFARNNIHKPDGIDAISVSALAALGLSYGAVDVIEDMEGNLYVLEVNTAFGLEGQTISLVGDAIKQLLEEA